MTALPRTTPLVPADHEFVMNSSAFASGSMTLPNQGPRLNPTGNVPHSSSRAFSSPNEANRSRTHSQAFVKLSELVNLGPIRLQSTSRWSITWESSRPAEMIRSISRLLPLATSFSPDTPNVGTATTIAATHPAQNCRLMRNLRSMMTENETRFT